MTQSTAEPSQNKENIVNQGIPSQKPTSDNTKKAMLKRKAQITFIICVLVVIIILVPFTLETKKLVTDFKKNAPSTYTWPDLEDFWVTIVMTVFCWGLESLFDWLFYDSYYKICKEKNDPQIRDMRTRKAVKNMYKLTYFIFSSSFGYFILKDSCFLPPGLGGKGSLYNQFTGFPYLDPPPYYRYYFTGTMGYHIGSLLSTFFSSKKQNDYLEMMFHHIVTAYLYTFSHMTNTMIGAIVAFIHDVTDILVTFTRVFAESDYKRVTAYSFIVAQFAWVYFRIYWLFQSIYVSTVVLEVYVQSPYVQPIFGFLLSCLLCLHIYWFILMQGILWNYFSKGVTEDLQNKLPDNKKDLKESNQRKQKRQ